MHYLALSITQGSKIVREHFNNIHKAREAFIKNKNSKRFEEQEGTTYTPYMTISLLLVTQCIIKGSGKVEGEDQLRS